jgi:hypothetical protein
MPADNEQLLVAAMLDNVEVGQEFRRIPSHMSVIGWIALGARQRPMLDNALKNVFQPNYLQNTSVGEPVMLGVHSDIPAHLLENVDSAPWVGLRALVKSLNGFPKNDTFIDTFSPHISESPDRTLQLGDRLSFPMISLIATLEGGDTSRMKQVQAVYPLGEDTVA